MFPNGKYIYISRDPRYHIFRAEYTNRKISELKLNGG